MAKRFIGIYSGRIGRFDRFDETDLHKQNTENELLKAQLGIVWKSEVIEQIILGKSYGSPNDWFKQEA